MVYTDGVPSSSIVISVALTLPTSDPGRPWDGPRLASLIPGSTMVLFPHLPRHLEFLRRWLLHLDTLLLMNGQFDLLCLRTIPRLRPLLSGRHTLIDVSVLNFQSSELRDEKSLKTIGTVIGTNRYEESHLDKLRRYPSWSDPELARYNGTDSHNTLEDVARLASMILRDYGPDTAKLSPYTIQFFSNTIWLCIRMSEAGIPMSRRRLERLESHLQSRISRCVALAASEGLLLEGVGSEKSKSLLVDRIIQQSLPPGTTLVGEPNPFFPSVEPVSASPTSSPSASPPSSSASSWAPPSIPLPDHPALELTEKKRKIAFSLQNRSLFRQYVPPSGPEARMLRLADTHTHFQKLVSSYLFPLLRHTRNKPTSRRSILIPSEVRPCHSSAGSPSPSAPSSSSASSPPTSAPASPPTAHPRRTSDVWIAYPTWFPTPGPEKDDAGSSGGTLQGRITCKNPAAQTFPPIIDRCMTSALGPRGSLHKMDLAQAELVVAALLSGDPIMMSIYQQADPDLHTDSAVYMYGEAFLLQKYGPLWRRHPVFRKSTNGERQQGKHVNFGDLFLASAPTMQATAREMSGGTEIPLPLFERMVLTRPLRRPGLWAWQQSLLAEASRTGKIVLPVTNHSRLFPAFQYTPSSTSPVGSPSWWYETCRDRRKHEAVNFPIQTIAGLTLLSIQHILSRSLPSLSDDRPWCRMFQNRYDAILFDTLDPPRLRSLLSSAVSEETRSGFWARLSTELGRTLPLRYEFSPL